ncbi:MAG: putative manganese-dependent inorganic diphosphatase [Treponema sp.]|nr:putative manganese-dependent inorganic diphosphatase [Treponema sp.]
MKKRIYVIGHRNPDTDSVVAAAAYAALKQAQGWDNCFAARAGNLNPQTEYVFERFKAEVPQYIPDLIPKAAYYLQEHGKTVNEEVPLWNALELMREENLRVLPVVNPLGVYKGMLHYRGFAQYMITHINPHKKSAFAVSLDQLIETLRAQPLMLFNNREVQQSSIVIAAAYNRYFCEHLNHTDPKNSLVIMGDRWDLQRYCIEQHVRALILSNNHTLDPGLTSLAKQNQVSVMSTPYDTSSSAMLVMYSSPVGITCDDSVPLMRLTDPLRKLKDPLSRAPSRCLPIGDEQDRVVGLIFEGDLIREPNIELIMVDHNEPSQAVEGIENYRILEVIDHHRLGNLSTRYPITFINQPVGATCTIITGLYRGQRVPMRKEIASILLCGILADTLCLKSATTTDTDRDAAAYLAVVTGLGIQHLGQDLLATASRVNTRPAEELILMDMKEYGQGQFSFTVSQIETDSTEALVLRQAEIFPVLEKYRIDKDLLFASLLVTDVTLMDSLFFVAGKRFSSALTFPQLEAGIYLLKGVVSRKKQLIPLLSELIDTLEG